MQLTVPDIKVVDGYLTLESPSCRVRVIADSISPTGKRLITYESRYWRSFHAEVMTHKAPSRSASSSRAIPVNRMLKQLWSDPAGPIHWGKAQKGMQAYEELTGWRLAAAKLIWRTTGKMVCFMSWLALQLGGAKQWVNRMGEPWQYITIIFTLTELDPILVLRDHPMAQPEFQELARFWRVLRENSTPRYLSYGEWHLPYVARNETYGAGHPLVGLPMSLRDSIRASTARCARVSYMNHDGTAPELAKDLALHDTLAYNDPPHASPLEHQATPKEPDRDGYERRFANLIGFENYRTQFEKGLGIPKGQS